MESQQLGTRYLGVVQRAAARMEATRDGERFHPAQCPRVGGDHDGIRGLLFLRAGPQ
jgi:hypothetical protein